MCENTLNLKHLLETVIKRFNDLTEETLLLEIEYKFLIAISVAFENCVVNDSDENVSFLVTLYQVYAKFLTLKEVVLKE